VVNERGLKRLGAKPLARIHHMTVIGGDPVIMLEAPLPATQWHGTAASTMRRRGESRNWIRRPGDCFAIGGTGAAGPTLRRTVAPFQGVTLLRRAKSGILCGVALRQSAPLKAHLAVQGPLSEAFLLAQGMSALPMFGCETTADYGKASRPFFISGFC